MTTHSLPFDGLSRALARPRRSRAVEVGAVVAALALHGALLVTLPWTSTTKSAAPVRNAPATEWIDVQPQPPEEALPPPEPAKAADLAPRAVPRAPRADRVVAPPPPAQASAVVVAKEDPLAPADLTDTVVMGNAAAYAGGASAASGTTTSHVDRVGGARAPARGNASGAPSAKPIAAGPDLSRRAQLAEGRTWSCPFPAEADEAQIDHAVVTLRIAIDGAGHAIDVTLVRDPGAGFGREAKTCAMAKMYQPARDGAGVAIAGTATVNVRFDR